jgi:mono/diheme cytochrome c family protein
MKFFTLAALLFLTAFAAFAATGSDGEALFRERCGICHQLPDADLLKAEQWGKALDSMQALMEKSGMPPLTSEEYKNLFNYLTRNAKR